MIVTTNTRSKESEMFIHTVAVGNRLIPGILITCKRSDDVAFLSCARAKICRTQFQSRNIFISSFFLLFIFSYVYIHIHIFVSRIPFALVHHPCLFRNNSFAVNENEKKKYQCGSRNIYVFISSKFFAAGEYVCTPTVLEFVTEIRQSIIYCRRDNATTMDSMSNT